MWIFLNNAFLSIVAERKSRKLLVRARRRDDLIRAFPRSAGQILETPNGDYRFRLSIGRKAVADLLVRRVAEIEYDNFKNSVAENDRHNAYLRVWTAMSAFQLPRRSPAAPQAFFSDFPGASQSRAAALDIHDAYWEPAQPSLPLMRTRTRPKPSMADCISGRCRCKTWEQCRVENDDPK